MITILVDHNIEGHATLLWHALSAEGWLELGLFRMVTFTDIKLAQDSSDRTVWQYAQNHNMLLLTGNRNMDGIDSLEQTIRDANLPISMPVVTIGNLDRVVEHAYRAACVTRLAEIGLFIETYRGVGRLYIP